jgi:predicted nucleic acid-binding protein
LRILVDTSVWADFLNGFHSLEERTLGKLIAGEDEICTCGVIVSEVFQGLRREKGRADLAVLFRDLVFLEPTGVDSYFRSADVYRALRRKGITVRSTIDCLIAILAEENACDVLTRDRDLRSILASGLVNARAFGHS